MKKSCFIINFAAISRGFTNFLEAPFKRKNSIILNFIFTFGIFKKNKENPQNIPLMPSHFEIFSLKDKKNKLFENLNFGQ